MESELYDVANGAFNEPSYRHRNATLKLYGGAVILEFCLVQVCDIMNTNRFTIDAAVLKNSPNVARGD